MRTLFVCLLGVVMMAASATTAGAVDPVKNKSKHETNLPPGANGICGSQKDAVYIFVAYKDGDIRSYKCENNVGSYEENHLKPGVEKKEKEGTLVLRKYVEGSGNDPCYQYQIDGETRVVCW